MQFASASVHLPRAQSGYTFIEMIIVLCIVMMVAANALPRYINITIQTKKTAVIGLASSLSTASATNYVGYKTRAVAMFKVSNCIDVAQGLDTGLPRQYTIEPQPIPAGKTVACLVTDNGDNSAVFVAVGTQ